MSAASPCNWPRPSAPRSTGSGQHPQPRPGPLARRRPRHRLHHEDFTAPSSRYDLILDIGGRNSISRLRQVLTPSGTLVIVGGEDGNRFTGGVGRQLRALMLSPFVGQRLTTFISTEHYSFMERLAAHITAGDVIPAIQGRFPLTDTAQAIDQLDTGRASGKSVIVIRDTITHNSGANHAA